MTMQEYYIKQIGKIYFVIEADDIPDNAKDMIYNLSIMRDDMENDTDKCIIDDTLSAIIKADRRRDSYKVDILKECKTALINDEYSKTRLKGESTKSINIDAGALDMLIAYYSGDIWEGVII